MSDNITATRMRLREHAAEEIRALLARRRMSAAELARRTGIKQSTISRRMTGETAFDLDDLELIAEVLQVEVVDLLPRKGTPTIGGAVPPEAIPRYSQPAEPVAIQTPRPRDNRPSGHPGQRRAPTTGRTSYVPRGPRGRQA